MLYESRKRTTEARERVQKVHGELQRLRHEVDSGPVEYRSASAYLMDQWRAHTGDRDASQRIEIFHRAAAHQKTSDNLGIVPDPIVGDVVNFIDATRPVVSLLGVKAMTTATWYRPKVTQHASVAKQGAAGAPADEKTELVSQKMVISRITGQAVTYGGYVNVSKQDIDFSSPNALDAVVNDLAAQYAIQTEAATGAALNGMGSTLEIAGVNTAAHSASDLVSAVMTALATVYGIAKGAGSYFIACSPDKVGVWAPLFAPVNSNASTAQLTGGTFGNGVFANVLGIPLVVSAGLPAGTIGVLSTSAALEAYEQRVGALQVIEPSVLGVQVAYAGYFTPVVIESTAAVRFIDAA